MVHRVCQVRKVRLGRKEFKVLQVHKVSKVSLARQDRVLSEVQCTKQRAR